jgi:hypothetical protein
MLNDIIAYEAGELSPAEIIHLFARLIASGQAWKLQGSYGRHAADYIRGGFISPEGVVDEEFCQQAGVDMSEAIYVPADTYRFPRICEKLNLGINEGFLIDGHTFSEIEFVAEYIRTRGGMDDLSDEFILDEAYALQEYQHVEGFPWLETGHYECTDENGSNPVWVEA